MKGNWGRYALVGAFLCALLAAWANVQFLKAREQKQMVLVVQKEIQPYTEIAADAVKLVEVVRDAVPGDAVTDVAALKGLYPRTVLIAGDVVRKQHMVPATGSNLSARLAHEKKFDKRAMAIQVNASTSVAGTLREGDPVDVLVAISSGSSSGGANNGTLSKVIAKRVPVLLVQKGQEGGLGGSDGMTVVLEVTPQEAEQIAFAQAQGMVWLITSPYETGGTEPGDTQGVNLKTFMEQHAPKESTKTAGGTHS